MVLQEMDASLKQVVGGSVGLVVCLALYLAWWCITFRPGGGATPFGTICIIVAVLSGILGLIFTLVGLAGIPLARSVPGWWFAVGGLVVYAVLMAATYLLFHRPVTTELFLIVGFAVLELCVLDAVHGSGGMGAALTMVMVVVLVLIVDVSLVAYVLYYRLEGVAGYFDGMVPLIAGIAYLAALICTTSFFSI